MRGKKERRKKSNSKNLLGTRKLASEIRKCAFRLYIRSKRERETRVAGTDRDRYNREIRLKIRLTIRFSRYERIRAIIDPSPATITPRLKARERKLIQLERIVNELLLARRAGE